LAFGYFLLNFRSIFFACARGHAAREHHVSVLPFQQVHDELRLVSRPRRHRQSDIRRSGFTGRKKVRLVRASAQEPDAALTASLVDARRLLLEPRANQSPSVSAQTSCTRAQVSNRIRHCVDHWSIGDRHEFQSVLAYVAAESCYQVLRNLRSHLSRCSVPRASALSGLLSTI
jgi:hypothetical protein